jgi:hypothetical protein
LAALGAVDAAAVADVDDVTVRVLSSIREMTR